MPSVTVGELENVDFSKVRNVLVVDDLSLGGIQVWSARTMAGFRSSTSPGEIDNLESLQVLVSAPVTEQKLAAVLSVLKVIDGPSDRGSLISVHEWEQWGFSRLSYPS